MFKTPVSVIEFWSVQQQTIKPILHSMNMLNSHEQSNAYGESVPWPYLDL